MKILLTGIAGFIGAATAERLVRHGHEVIGIDNLNDYYDVKLKYARLRNIGIDCEQTFEYNKIYRSAVKTNLAFIRLDLSDKKNLDTLCTENSFDIIVNLAAQAGVRYSIQNPYAYLESNIVGFLNILECCRFFSIKHLVFASSSSVYGLNDKVPFSEEDNVDRPVSLYAASKKSNELMAHAYSKLYNIPTTGLRFFTVYGPWGRPDMSAWLFANAISNGRPINVFNNGDMIRDFTYIDDIVDALVKIIELEPIENPDGLRYNIFNIGGSSPVRLLDFITEIENACGKTAEKIMLPMQPGDVYQTMADTEKLENVVGFKPSISISEGIRNFIDWYISDANPLK